MQKQNSGLAGYFGALVNKTFGNIQKGVGDAVSGAVSTFTGQAVPKVQATGVGKPAGGGLAGTYKPAPRPAAQPQMVTRPRPVQNATMDQYRQYHPAQPDGLMRPYGDTFTGMEQVPATMAGAPTRPGQVPNQVYDQRINEYIASLLGPQDPARQNLPGRYPILNELPYLREVEQRLGRPGLADLMVLQSIFEGAGGRTGNPFGVLPGGEGSGRRARFDNLREAIDYQVSPNVLGGGVGGKLNIIGRGHGPITPEDVQWLYGGGSYDAGQTYTDYLYPAFKQIRGY